MFSVNTRCIYATEFLEHLLYLIEDLTIEGDCNSLNFGTLSQVKHTIALIVSFLFERQTLELDIKPFLKVFVMHIASPSEDVRIVTNQTFTYITRELTVTIELKGIGAHARMSLQFRSLAITEDCSSR
ncbi:hypothetical protein TNCV_146081 [Trichonephila clavipes]|nr:hypothetical protein TNCV_146081 [Trichonephila clavipes]